MDLNLSRQAVHLRHHFDFCFAEIKHPLNNALLESDRLRCVVFNKLLSPDKKIVDNGLTEIETLYGREIAVKLYSAIKSADRGNCDESFHTRREIDELIHIPKMRGIENIIHPVFDEICKYSLYRRAQLEAPKSYPDVSIFSQ